MHPYSFDLGPAMAAAVAVVSLISLGSHLLTRYRSRTSRLRMLTGTRAQHTALRLALTPALQEFLPLLDRAGQEIRAIVIVPTLSGADGEPLTSEIEQLSGSATFILRLAHRVGTATRTPDDVAGALAESLLYLFREASSITVVRQTPASAIQQTPVQAAPRKPVARNGLSNSPRQGAQNEAEETVVAFKPNPLGRSNNQSS